MISKTNPDPDLYLAGARSCCEYLGISDGEQVLLMPTWEFLESDPLSTEALSEAARERGAKVSIAVIEALGTRGEPTEAIADAVKASDIFIGMGDKTPNPITGHCLTALSARWDYGARQVDLRGGNGILASECSRFPVEITLAIARYLYARLKSHSELEIFDDRGTALKFPYDPEEVFFGGSFESDTFRAGQRCDWPLGQIMIHPGDGFSGTAMIDSIRGVPKKLDRPVRYSIDDCKVEIEDREETRRINVEMAKPHNTNLASKLFLGINPKGSIQEGLTRSNVGSLAQAAGVTYVAIGDKAGFTASHFNTGGFMFKPNIRVGSELILVNGRFSAFDDPHVRSVAARYGEPDQLLAQVE